MQFMLTVHNAVSAADAFGAYADQQEMQQAGTGVRRDRLGGLPRSHRRAPVRGRLTVPAPRTRDTGAGPSPWASPDPWKRTDGP